MVPVPSVSVVPVIPVVVLLVSLLCVGRAGLGIIRFILQRLQFIAGRKLIRLPLQHSLQAQVIGGQRLDKRQSFLGRDAAGLRSLAGPIAGPSALALVVLVIAVSVSVVPLPVVIRMEIIVQLEDPVPITVIGHGYQQVVRVIHSLQPVLHGVDIGILHLVRSHLTGLADPVSIGIVLVVQGGVLLAIVNLGFGQLVGRVIGILPALLQDAVAGLAVVGPVPHIIVLEDIIVAALLLLVLGSGQELAVLIVGEGSGRFYDLEVVLPVLGMLVGMLAPVGEQVVVTAVLMLPVVLVIPGVAVEGLNGILSHDKATVIVGIIVLAYHPAAVITDVLHGDDLVPCVIGVVGTDSVGTVDFGYPVDGVIDVSGHSAGPVRYLGQVIV